MIDAEAFQQAAETCGSVVSRQTEFLRLDCEAGQLRIHGFGDDACCWAEVRCEGDGFRCAVDKVRLVGVLGGLQGPLEMGHSGDRLSIGSEAVSVQLPTMIADVAPRVFDGSLEEFAPTADLADLVSGFSSRAVDVVQMQRGFGGWVYVRGRQAYFTDNYVVGLHGTPSEDSGQAVLAIPSVALRLLKRIQPTRARVDARCVWLANDTGTLVARLTRSDAIDAEQWWARIDGMVTNWRREAELTVEAEPMAAVVKVARQFGADRLELCRHGQELQLRAEHRGAIVEATTPIVQPGESLPAALDVARTAMLLRESHSEHVRFTQQVAIAEGPDRVWLLAGRA